MTMTDMAIVTERLRKTFGPKVAVDDLTLHVQQGEVFGFLGPNGAGKSTSVKMLLGLVAPSEGGARVLGEPPGNSAALARIGFLPEHFRFHEWLHAEELLDLHGRLYGMPAADRRSRGKEVLDLVGLSEHARRPIAGFSKGMLQRIGLAQALINRPALVFLDEPTSALDPFGRMLVRSIIHTLKEQGVTVFLNSHLLGEVEATCDRVCFIREGRVLQTLALHDMRKGRLRATITVDVLSEPLCNALAQLVGAPPEVQSGQNGAAQTTALLDLPDEAVLPQVAEQILAHGARLYALTPQRMSLEDIFLDVVGRQDSGQ